MTKFNPENKDRLTYGECLKPAMEITDQADADQYLKAYIAFTQKFIDSGEVKEGKTAEQIVKSNLGYFAGYYSDETRVRVEKLFNCSHPVFGAIAQGKPTPEQAFNKGIQAGLASRNKAVN